MAKHDLILGEANPMLKGIFESMMGEPYRVNCPPSEVLVDYQEGLLSLSNLLQLYLHIRGCPDCQPEFAFLTELDREPFPPMRRFKLMPNPASLSLAEFLEYLKEMGKQIINAIPPPPPLSPQPAFAVRGSRGSSVASALLRRTTYHADDYEITLTVTPPTSQPDIWMLNGEIYDSTFGELSGNIYLLAGDELATSCVLSEEDEGEFLLEGVASGNYTILLDIPETCVQIEQFRLTWTAQELADLLLAQDEPADLSALADSLRPYLTLEVIEELKRRVDGEMYRHAQRALEMAEVAETVAGLISTPDGEALALWAKGNALVHLVRSREALACYQRTESIYAAQGRQIKVVRLQSNQIAVLQGMGEYQEALTLYQKARLICEAIGSQAQRYLAGIKLNIGVTYRQLGDLEAALAAYEQAYTLFATLPSGGQEKRMAMIDINRANVLKDIDRFSEAEPLYIRARDVLEGAGYDQEVARANLNLGQLAYRRGQYQAALRYLETARSGFAAIRNLREVAFVDLRCCFVYRHLNMLQETIELATKAEQTFQQETMPWAQAYALSNQGIGYQRLGAYAEAEERLIKAQQIFQEQGAPLRAQQLFLARGQLALEAGDFDKAQQLASQVEQGLDSETWPSLAASGHLLLAQVALIRSPPNLPQARQRTEQAQAIAEAHSLHEITITVYHLMGQILERTGDLEGASQAYQSAIQRVEWLRQLLALDEFRMGFMEDKLPIYASAVHLSQKMATQAINGGSPSLAELFYTLNLATAAPLRRLPPVERTLTEDDHKLRQRLEQLREQWYWHQSKLEGDADTEQKQIVYTPTGIYKEKRHELEMGIADLMRRWQVRTTPLLAPSEATSLFSTSASKFLASVQAHLRPQDILLHYYLVEGHVQALLVTPSEIHLVRELVSLERLQRTYKRWQSDLDNRFPFAASPQSDVRRAKGHLYRFHKALVAPLANHLTSCQHIFLVMPPEWHDLPVSAFFDRQSYLAERYQLTYLSAPEVLLREGARSLVTPQAEESLATSAGAVVVGYSNKGDVPHTLEEARQVAGMLTPHLPTTLLLEDEATFTQLHSASQNSRLLHLASHAIFRPDNPLFSWVRLADNHLKVLDLYDQISLPHHPLVVLSACETGRGKARGGGLLGMARGFMAAGANGLIVSLWKAPDESSAQLMADFYPHLLQPSTTATAALQHAQQQAIARDYHPYHWAGFIAIRG